MKRGPVTREAYAGGYVIIFVLVVIVTTLYGIAQWLLTK
jgi:hypothetical protein